MSYNSLLSFGDVIPLKIECHADRLRKEIKDSEFKQYNPKKPIPRYGLNIINSKCYNASKGENTLGGNYIN